MGLDDKLFASDVSNIRIERGSLSFRYDPLEGVFGGFLHY